MAMRTALLVILALASCSKSSEDAPAPVEKPAATPAPPPAKPAPAPPAAKPADDITTANAAYDAKQYAKCAELYLAISNRPDAPKRLQRESAYNAGCCYAQDGKPDAAFPQLERALALGMRDKKHVETDTDLVKVRGDARWPKLLAALDKANADADKAIKQPALRKEILALRDEDQKARFAWIAKQDDKKLAADVEAIDRKTTMRMHEVIAKYGWPGKSLVGEDGANSAWLLVQHADKDLALQKDVLARMEPMVKTEEVSAIDYGYLWDRIAVAEHRPQRYGTQFNEKQEPQPIEDEAHIDERRASIGLPSMAEYREQMRKMYGPPKK
jgi:hypothetical protein